MYSLYVIHMRVYFLKQLGVFFMKSILILGLIFLFVLPLSAAEYVFDIETDEKGYYNDSSDFDGWTVNVRRAKMDASAEKVKIWVGSTVLYEGPITAEEWIALGHKTDRLSVEVVGASKKGQVITMTVDWAFSKSAEVFSKALTTNKGGKAKYKAMIESGEFTALSFVASHNCHITIKADGQKAFCGEVACGTSYVVNADFKDSIEYKVTKAPAQKKMYIDLNVSGSAITKPEVSIAGIENIGTRGADTVSFTVQTNEEGCIHSDTHELDTQGVAPEIRYLIINQEFTNLEAKINGITFFPEYLGKYQEFSVYSVGVSFKSDRLNIGLNADGGKPNCDTKVIVSYANQDSAE